MDLELLIWSESVEKGLTKFAEKCGTKDSVKFLTNDDVTYYMLCENRMMEYIGLTIIEGGEEVGDIFFQSEDDIEGLVRNVNFDWYSSSADKVRMLMEYIY
jgi:hypothetical protein